MLINPPPAVLGRRHAVLWGRGNRTYHSSPFAGPLSIKAMFRGGGVWETPDSRYLLDASSYLVLNARQSYTVAIESPTPVETFCVFFEEGFVEDIWRSSTTPDSRLLDDPFARPSLEIPETLQPLNAGMGELLAGLRARLAAPREPVDGLMVPLGEAVLSIRSRVAREIARLPLERPSTRRENHTRLIRAKNFIDAQAGSSPTLKEIAREACLSPYHLHRLFKAAFGETPHEYLSRRRAQTAARLLAETALSVTEIALDCGFCHGGTLSAAFRERYGVSPRQYRQAVRPKRIFA